MKRIFFLLLTSMLVIVQIPKVSASVMAGNAILFDGFDDFIRIPDAPHLGGMPSLTVELWFMPYDTLRVNPIVTKSDGIAVMTDRSYELSLYPHTPSWSVFTGSTGWTWLYGSTPPPLSVGQWTHIAATYNSIEGVANLYFNGSLFLTTTTDASGSPISESIRDSSEDLILGAVLANAYHGSEFSFGLIDEVRMWNYARSTLQISQNFNKLVNPADNGLIGYWNFDEDFGDQRILDLSLFGLDCMLGSSLDAEACDPIRVASTVQIIPEPSTLLLLSLGAFFLRRKK